MQKTFMHMDRETISNKNYRNVVFTGEFQLVYMNILPGEMIGVETHAGIDQFFRIEKGTAVFILNGKKITAKDGDAVVVPAGTKHNVKNETDKPLKLYTIYSSPTHPAGTVEKNKPKKRSKESVGRDVVDYDDVYDPKNTPRFFF